VQTLPHAARLPIIAMTAAAMEEGDPKQLMHTLLAWMPPPRATKERTICSR
jgi:hypothetical protein